MYKQIGLLFLLTGVCAVGFANPLWHCTATNEKEAVWNWYGNTHEETRRAVDKQCSPFNDHKACGIVCFPPRVYWRCYSHDTLPIDANSDPKNPIKQKPGVWYWSSFSRQIAINGARDACRHNSPYGGCYVNENSCASSDVSK